MQPNSKQNQQVAEYAATSGPAALAQLAHTTRVEAASTLTSITNPQGTTTSIETLATALRTYEIAFTWLPDQGKPTIAQFRKANDDGVFLVLANQYAVIEDGQVTEGEVSGRAQVQSVLRIERDLEDASDDDIETPLSRESDGRVVLNQPAEDESVSEPADEPAGDPIEYPIAAAPEAGSRPGRSRRRNRANDENGGSCLCGCGNPPAGPRSVYRQGHDARHVKVLRERVLADELGIDTAFEQLASPVLKQKLREQLAKRGRQ